MSLLLFSFGKALFFPFRFSILVSVQKQPQKLFLTPLSQNGKRTEYSLAKAFLTKKNNCQRSENSCCCKAPKLLKQFFTISYSCIQYLAKRFIASSLDQQFFPKNIFLGKALLWENTCCCKNKNCLTLFPYATIFFF